MHFFILSFMLLLFLHYIFYYVIIIPAVMSKMQSFMLLFILHYVFDMFVLFVYYFGIIFCCVYNNVAMFDLFQHVSK